MNTREGWLHQGSRLKLGVGRSWAAAPPSDLGDNWDTQRREGCQKSSWTLTLGDLPREEAHGSLQRRMQTGLQIIMEGIDWGTAKGRSWAGKEGRTAAPVEAEQREISFGADNIPLGASS